jgi:hypothetical protein
MTLQLEEEVVKTREPGYLWIDSTVKGLCQERFQIVG